MKQLNPPKQEAENKSLSLSKRQNGTFNAEPAYAADYEGGYVDSYYEASNQTGEKQFLGALLATIRKHWLLIASITLVVTGLTIFYVAQKPDYYKAEARVQVNTENNPAAGARNGGSSVVVSNPGGDPAYFTTQLQIIEGAGLLRRVAKTLDLEHNQAFLDPQHGKNLTAWQNVQKMFGFYRPPAPNASPSAAIIPGQDKLDLESDRTTDIDKETEKYAWLVAMLKRNLTVTPVKDTRTVNRETRLIEIDYQHEDPALAAKIANTIGDIYVLQNLEQKIQTNASAGDFLQKRVAELQADIRSGEERLINYSRSNQLLSLDSGQNTAVQRLSDLNMKLGQTENERIAAQAAYQAALQNQMRTATVESKDSQVVILENRLNDLRQKLAQLKTQYTDQWFEVVQTKKDIEGTENQLNTLRKRASDIQMAGLQEKLDDTSAREKVLRENLDKQREEVLNQNEAAINYNIIKQEIDTNKTLLAGLLQRSREVDVVMNDTPNNVLVLDRALLPRAPIGPERTRNVLLAFLLSLMAGCGLAFMLDWLNDSIHNSDDIESSLGLPLLAAIPSASLGLGKRFLPKNLLPRRKNRLEKSYYNLAGFEKPKFLEAYLQLRTHLLLSSAGGPPQTILITSGEEGEGKTMTALNLASSLAKTSDKVLLIDADLRCPRLHNIKDLSNENGLTTLLTNKEINDELIEKTIQKDESGELHILTAGERTTNPANLLCSAEMRNLLTQLSATYTHIIIDSPPVLYFADSTILSTLVDSVIIVVRDNVSSRQMVLKAKKTLQNVGAKVIGMVMNGIPTNWASYGRYESYELNAAELQSESGYQALKLN